MKCGGFRTVRFKGKIIISILAWAVDPLPVVMERTAWRSRPPVLRNVGFREILIALSVPGQVGYPPSMSTDACSGYSPMKIQSP